MWKKQFYQSCVLVVDSPSIGIVDLTMRGFGHFGIESMYLWNSNIDDHLLKLVKVLSSYIIFSIEYALNLAVPLASNVHNS